MRKTKGKKACFTNLLPIDFLKSSEHERIVDFQLDFVDVHHFLSP